MPAAFVWGSIDKTAYLVLLCVSVIIGKFIIQFIISFLLDAGTLTLVGPLLYSFLDDLLGLFSV